ncbi:MAG TPA: alpha/beta hydrolase, partial [Chitinophagaceae bacterium]
VELQAHGHTSDRGTPLSFEQDADDVATLLSALHIPSADIFGFSNGASTTLELAIRHPGLVRKIIVASTFYKKSGAQPWFFPMIGDATFEAMPAPYKKAFLDITHDTPALRLMYQRDVTRMRTFKDIPDQEVEAITAPALVICGDKDVATPAHAVEIASRLPRARLAILPSGHGDYIGELATLRPGATTFMGLPVILQFLSDNDPVTNH